MSVVTFQEVRNATGLGTDVISDTQIQEGIKLVEGDTERFLNCSLTPKLRIDMLSGKGNNVIRLSKNPLLKLSSLKIDGTAITVSEVYWNREAGILKLKTGAETGVFTVKTQSVIAKYYHGYLELSGTQTTTSAAETAGGSVVVAVADASEFFAGDHIEIYGTDGNREFATISSVSGNNITVDNLVLSHESGSIFEKLEVPKTVKRFILHEAAIYTLLRGIGASYTFATSYSAPEYTITKGVPYPHFEKAFNENIKLRDRYMDQLVPRISIG